MWKKYLIVFCDLAESGDEYERIVCFDSADEFLHYMSNLDDCLVDNYTVYEYLYHGKVLLK